MLYGHWFKSIGFKPASVLISNSLLALIGLTVSGLGVSYLPQQCLMPMIDAGTLRVVKVTPALPEAPYAAMYKREQRSTVIPSIVKLAEQSCDFGRMFQTE